MISRATLCERYRRNRERSREIFNLITDEAYYSQPIALRHPLVFYEGHLPAFSLNTVVKRGLGLPGIDADLEALFARGIDPEESVARSATTSLSWPRREQVRAFADEADRRVLHALETANLDQPGHPLLDRGEAVYTILEHEAMHQETLLYLWHRLPYSQKRRPADYRPRTDGVAPRQEWIAIPGGQVTLGVDRDRVPFAWDNEGPACVVHARGFATERHNVTNARFLEFVKDGGYSDPRWWTDTDWQWLRAESIAHPLFWERRDHQWQWRGMFDLLPLPMAWPVYVSFAEASAFTRWSGTRLLSEAEYQRAAYGSPDGERSFPWGEDPPTTTRGVFDFVSWDPQPVGSCPTGRSSWGVDDLVGNGWEWTSTRFAPFPGFRAMASYPEYSADFFDDQHVVLKGASPVTARALVRPTFRNWFRARYPYVYATFRCADDSPARP